MIEAIFTFILIVLAVFFGLAFLMQLSDEILTEIEGWFHQK